MCGIPANFQKLYEELWGDAEGRELLARATNKYAERKALLGKEMRYTTTKYNLETGNGKKSKYNDEAMKRNETYEEKVIRHENEFLVRFQKEKEAKEDAKKAQKETKKKAQKEEKAQKEAKEAKKDKSKKDKAKKDNTKKDKVTDTKAKKAKKDKKAKATSVVYPPGCMLTKSEGMNMCRSM